MGLVKVVKNSAFFKRYQVKPRRRREGKTDYHARRRLVIQDKNKYNAAKYRFIVRKKNTQTICQVAYATLQGDRILCQASSKELKNYGLDFGLTNYAACYSTGLLLARRLLHQLGYDKKFVGQDANGECNAVEESEDQAPFKCFLDLGIAKATKGNRIFGAMKGAIDGGLNIPHNVKCFPGFNAVQDSKEGSYDAEVHRKRIFGLHVEEYVKAQQNLEADQRRNFGKDYMYKILEKGAENIYKEVHQKIRANPVAQKKVQVTQPVRVREGDYVRNSKTRYYRPRKLTKPQRHQRVKEKIALAMNQIQKE